MEDIFVDSRKEEDGCGSTSKNFGGLRSGNSENHETQSIQNYSDPGAVALDYEEKLVTSMQDNIRSVKKLWDIDELAELPSNNVSNSSSNLTRKNLLINNDTYNSALGLALNCSNAEDYKLKYENESGVYNISNQRHLNDHLCSPSCKYCKETVGYINVNNASILSEFDSVTNASIHDIAYDTEIEKINYINRIWRIQNAMIINGPKTPTKVQFASNKDLREVHPMISWDFAYRQSRKSSWLQSARKRREFEILCHCVELDISYVFHPEYREKIWRERMCNL